MRKRLRCCARIRIYEKTLGPNHPNVAYSLGGLADMYRVQGRYAEALPIYQRVLKIRETTLGPEHPATADALNNLGLLYHEQGDDGEALPLFLRAVRLTRRLPGPKSRTIINLNNIALV